MVPASPVTSPVDNDDAEIDLLLRQASADRMDPGERLRGLPHPCFFMPYWFKYDSIRQRCPRCGMSGVEMRMRYQTTETGKQP